MTKVYFKPLCMRISSYRNFMFMDFLFVASAHVKAGEVDFFVEHDGSVKPIEVKSGRHCK
ncbi:MAG: hypothetical protein E7046_10510 [Lentisphaerae bacterium]|nr:hypothetical protein [Lentisphaerota bacterium]